MAVEKLVQGVAGGEGRVQQGEELPAHPALHVHGVGGVEPNGFFSSVFLLLSGVIPGLGKGC